MMDGRGRQRVFGFDVKICGLKTTETIETALSRGATHIGFVHFERSPRHLDLGDMMRLRDLVGDRAETVIVTVDPDDALLTRFGDEVHPHWIQLHGRETPDRVNEVCNRARAWNGRVMKALPIAERADLEAIAPYADIADRILLDSKRPKGSDLPGGNGVAFDWTLLREPVPAGVGGLDRRLPVMLSGGLDAGNVGYALRIAEPAGIDVSSGVESAPGVKDVARIHQFFDALDRFAATAEKVRAS